MGAVADISNFNGVNTLIDVIVIGALREPDRSASRVSMYALFDHTDGFRVAHDSPTDHG